MGPAAVAAALACALALLTVPPGSLALDPPSRGDPRSSAGRNTCGTLGIGYYKQYRHGIRWFGDFRGTIAAWHTFCIDLGFWYPSWLIEAQVARALVVGKQSTSTVRVPSAAGAAMPNIRPSLSGRGIGGLPAQVPAAEAVSAVVATPAAKVRLALSTVAVPARVAVGEASRDRVTIAGPLPSWHGTIAVRIHGPFPSAAAIRCDGKPAWKSSLSAVGSGVFTTPPAFLDKVGLYTYEEVVPRHASQVGLRTRCGVRRENFRVEAQPRVRTIVSDDRVDVGGAVSDRVFVEGLAGQRATVQAALYGPFATREALSCGGKPIWTGSLDVATEGEYSTVAFTPEVPGFYVYRETIPERGFVRAAQTPCPDTPETAVVVGKPQIRTTVSRRSIRSGGTVTDRVTVTGLGPIAVRARVRAWGPFATRSAIRCSGTPYWSGSFLAPGHGTYTIGPVRLREAGYYTFQESIAEGPANGAFTAPCPQAAETTRAAASPTVATVSSQEVVLPSSRIFDRIHVQGLGRTPAAIDVQLFGPFGSRSRVRCTGRPFWQGRVYAAGNGVLRSPSVQVTRPGFYGWREHVVGSELVSSLTTPCALTAETTLVRPEIVTGRGDVSRHAGALGGGGLAPARVGLSSAGIDAPVFPAQIDVRRGVLGVPPGIAQAGWWRDGTAPGAKSGAILIAGHVDSAKQGAGAFFRLHEARAGALAQITTANGRTFAYRVVSVRTYPKSELPASVYSRTGAPRLVLVTCGGLFDYATGHYPDNVVLTALPA